MSPEIVLIVSDQAGSGPAQTLVERWKAEPQPPMFAQVRAELWNGGAPPLFTMAVVAGLSASRIAHTLALLAATGKPVLCVAPDSDPTLRKIYPSVIFLPQHPETWADVVVQFAGEVFRRVQASGRVHRAEQELASLQAQATLGRYIIEVRHGFNNALTSVLGNSELIMMDSDALQPRMREQVESIHNMAIRMHQVMQRFTSLETELRVSEKPSQTETKAAAEAATASA